MNRFPYLLNRNGYYYCRISVPLALTKFWGKKELWCSLRTRDSSEAKIRCLIVREGVQSLFIASLSGIPVSDSTLNACLRQFHSTPFNSLSPARLIQSNVSEHRSDPAMSGTKEEDDNFSNIYKEYLKECIGGATTKRTKQQVQNLWMEIIGDGPVSAIGKAEAREFKRILMKLPSNLHKRFKGQPIKAINLDAIPAEQRLSVKSVNISLGYMHTFVNWLIANGYYNSANPFSGIQLKDNEKAQDKKHPFTQDQLKAIFSSPVYKGCKDDTARGRYETGSTIIKDGLYWVPLIALYSGARMQEICQLYVSDIKQVGGIWVFDMNDTGDDKLLKNSSSQRKTPIHPKLIELGLLEYRDEQVKANKKRLFSDLPMGSNGTYSSVFSKRFNHFLERFEIKTDKTSFHSFRHTFIDAMRNTDVHREVREALVGHSGSKTAHDNYGSAMGLQRLYEGVRGLKYSCVFLE